jgi:hypothetical protein
MIPEVGGRGAWSRWTNDANLAKFDAPTVEGVEYPSVGLSVARNDIQRGELLLHTYAATPSHAGRATSVRVTQIPDVSGARITCDGEDFSAWRPAGANAIELDLTIGDHTVVVRTGYHGRETKAWPRSRDDSAPTPSVATTTATSSRPAKPGPAAIAAAASSCQCCC